MSANDRNRVDKPEDFSRIAESANLRVMELLSQFLSAVEKEFPQDFLSRSPEDLSTYGKDWTKIFPPRPSAIVFPRSTEEVVKLVKLCSKFQIPLVPSGGRTGLAAGAVAAQGEVVLSLARMNRMGAVDPLSQIVRVQAGAVTEAVHQHCEPYGLTWPVDFASKGSSQVGGNISTNAGGVKVIRYGMTRQWVLGLQVVTMQGEVLELNGALEKNNTGLDFRQLFIGSEGILGIVTEATLKLTRLPGELNVFFFAVEDISAVLRLFLEARKAPFELMAFECLTHSCLEVVEQQLGHSSPLQTRSGAYVLLEVERPASANAQEVLDAWLTGLFEKNLVLDGTLAQSPREARAIWAIREGISESLTLKGLLHKNDIAVPIAALEGFVAEMEAMFKRRHSDVAVYTFGHIGDGNLHVNTMKPSSMSKEEFLKFAQEADQELFALVGKYQGSISAEHGIGLLKKAALGFTKSAEELAFMRAMKKIFDPQGLLNPGKIFDLNQD